MSILKSFSHWVNLVHILQIFDKLVMKWLCMVQKVILVPIILLEYVHYCGYNVLTYHHIYQMRNAAGNRIITLSENSLNKLEISFESIRLSGLLTSVLTVQNNFAKKYMVKTFGRKLLGLHLNDKLQNQIYRLRWSFECHLYDSSSRFLD